MADPAGREARRQANFAREQKASPLPPSIADIPLAGGLELAEDEFVVRTAKDWGSSISSLVLTTRRLICPTDLTGRSQVAIPLTEVRDVQFHKHLIGFPTIVIERVDQPPASFPAHINGARIRADIAAMVEAGQRAAIPSLSVVTPPPTAGDRYERLRQIGELRASGVLSESEFQEEKARILKES
jgi:putative oligomerization/nucleic acid binding protein